MLGPCFGCLGCAFSCTHDKNLPIYGLILGVFFKCLFLHFYATFASLLNDAFRQLPVLSAGETGLLEGAVFKLFPSKDLLRFCS